MTRQKVTFIFGDQGSGKTGLLKHLIKNKKAAPGLLLRATRQPDLSFKHVKKDTEVIYFDETFIPLELIKMLATAEQIFVEKQSQDPFRINRPHIIFALQELTQADLVNRGYYEFYNCIRYDENTSSVIYTDGTGKEQSIIVDRLKNGERANAPQ